MPELGSGYVQNKPEEISILEGATILNTFIIGDKGEQDMFLIVKLAEGRLLKGCSVVTIGVWQDEEGNGPGYLDLCPHSAPRSNWDELCPEGRHVWYEGDDPEGFAKTMKEEFDFDPASDVDRWCEEGGWGFSIPAGKMEAIYASNRWPIGS